jgi:glycolate oxidase FAD binding subunit
MGEVFSPATEGELAGLLRGATEAFAVEGSGSKRGLGRPAAAAQTLSLAAFKGINLYEPEELILEAGAATPMADIEAAVAEKNQQLAFEPPDFSTVAGSGRAGTIGGILACNLSGPRRIKAGAARDHILGVTGVSGHGEVFKAGARVVKNVTGYDLPKLMAGSFGTLAAITSVTFKVLPRPETEETICLQGLSDGEAVKAMSLAMQSAAEVSGAAHVPGRGTFLRLEGVAPSVAYRRDRLLSLFHGWSTLLPEADSKALWRVVRDATVMELERDDCLWRISVPPMEGAAVTARIAETVAARWFYDWAGGLIWLAVPATEDAAAVAIRAAISSGHATLFRAPAAVRNRVAVFQPQPAALAALARRVKAAFDPRGLLNPGRLAEGL